MEIKKSKLIGQDGLFSTQSFEIDDIVHKLEGPLLSKPTRESIHIGDNKHIVDPMGSYMNHSFDPNTNICGLYIIAAKCISPGDELTFDYNNSEIAMACPFMVNGRAVTGK